MNFFESKKIYTKVQYVLSSKTFLSELRMGKKKVFLSLCYTIFFVFLPPACAQFPIRCNAVLSVMAAASFHTRFYKGMTKNWGFNIAEYTDTEREVLNRN